MELEIVPQLKGNNYKVTLLDMLNTPSMHRVESHLYLVREVFIIFSSERFWTSPERGGRGFPQSRI